MDWETEIAVYRKQNNNCSKTSENKPFPKVTAPTNFGKSVFIFAEDLEAEK